MTRNFAVLVCCCALSFVGCDKIPFLKKKTPPAAPAVAEAPAAGAPAPAPEAAPAPAPAPKAGVPAEPSKPDLAPAPATAAAATPAPKAPPKPAIDQNAGVMVLCYHNIEDTKGSKALTISSAQFKQEMQGLKDNGYAVIPMQDFLAWRRGEKNIPHKSCIITIDDGWVSGYTVAWPILKEYGYPFTLFIYVNYVGTGGKSMSWKQLEEMRDAGVDIQSHTYSHSNLKIPGGGMDKTHAAMVKKDVEQLGLDGWIRKEIIDSKKVLEQQLGIKVNAIAYPFGVYNNRARELVKEAGYEAGFTVYGQKLSMTSPSYDLLGRYAIEANKPKIFADALKMIGGGTGGVDTAAPSTMSQLAVTAMITQPMNNETIQTATPLIKANLSSMGDIEAGTVEIRLSGVGPLPVTYDPATKIAQSQVKQKLAPGNYFVIVAAKVGGQRAEARWEFSVGAGASAKPSAPAPAPAKAPGKPAPPSPPKL